MGAVWLILYACSVPSGDFVILLVRHIQANLKSEIALHNGMDCFLTLQCGRPFYVAKLATIYV